VNTTRLYASHKLHFDSSSCNWHVPVGCTSWFQHTSVCLTHVCLDICLTYPCADLQEDIEDALRTSRQGNLLRQGLQVGALTSPADSQYAKPLPFTPGQMGVKWGMKGGALPSTAAGVYATAAATTASTGAPACLYPLVRAARVPAKQAARGGRVGCSCSQLAHSCQYLCWERHPQVSR
jgi:hypothetical protein